MQTSQATNSGAPFPISWGGTVQQNGYHLVPKDVIFIILSLCFPADLPNLARLCKRWKEITREYGEKILRPIAFGKQQYEEYIGTVPEEPPIPLAAVEYIVKDPTGYLLTLIPVTINGQPVTMNYIEVLVMNPLKGNPTKFRFVYEPIREAYGDIPNETSHWVLMNINVVGKAKNEGTQEALVKQENWPEFLSTIMSVFMQRISKGEFVLSKGTYTRLKHKIAGYRIIVGAYSASGLHVHYLNNSDYSNVGIAGARKSNGVARRLQVEYLDIEGYKSKFFSFVPGILARQTVAAERVTELFMNTLETFFPNTDTTLSNRKSLILQLLKSVEVFTTTINEQNQRVITLYQKMQSLSNEELESDSTSDLIFELNEAVRDTSAKFRTLWKEAHSTGVFQLTEDDRNFLGYQEQQLTLDFSLDCTEFALLKTRERQALPWLKSIFEGKEASLDKNKFYWESAISLLESWGYRRANELNKFDLIVYFITQPNLRVTHTSLYVGNGKALSKLGPIDPNIYEHDFADVPSSYGNHFLIFRKTQQ